MRLIHTKATVEDGQLFLDESLDNLPAKIKRVDVIVVLEDEKKQEEFEQVRTEMQEGFKEAGIVTREQIMQLIKDVKKEIYQEQHECKESF
ncbi:MULTISPECIES: hypothetical protein [Spirulina sp. CCY15215]|uniref:hypothetical protein n=1 Tax=Spirulina sp. CCY15215 TaxID=2767591 RepID=UPI00195190E4|nr:hypothetical protein [Spirulina major]